MSGAEVDLNKDIQQSTEATPNKYTNDDDNALNTGETPVGKLRPFFAVGIFLESLYLEWPDCFGCSGKHTVLWFVTEQMNCKFTRAGHPTSACIIFNKTNVECYPVVTTCFKSQHQCCCTDFRVALPTDNEVPMMCNILGLTLCYDLSPTIMCCASIDEIRGKVNEDREI